MEDSPCSMQEFPIPDRFYVFVNAADPMVWHNVNNVGAIVSAGAAMASEDPAFGSAYADGTAEYAPFVPNPGLASRFVSKFSISASSSYAIELELENFRRKFHPLCPSRLSCVFAFGSEEDCRRVAQKYRWDISTVRMFHLAPTPPYTRIHRANMELVSLLRGVFGMGSISQNEFKKYCEYYWAGGGRISVEVPITGPDGIERRVSTCDEVWEYLIEGRLNLVH